MCLAARSAPAVCNRSTCVSPRLQASCALTGGSYRTPAMLQLQPLSPQRRTLLAKERLLSTTTAHAHQQPYDILDEALEHSVSGSGKFQVLLLSCIGLVWAGDAAEVMVLTYLGPAASCSFGIGSPTCQSLLASAVFVGMLLGATFWGFLADELGRKNALTASTVVVVGAGLASAGAPTAALLLLSRVCVGVGLAGAPVGFTIMMELLPPSSRSLWGVLIELTWTAGVIAEAALAWAVLDTYGWRLLLLLSAAPLGLLLLLLHYLPESPRWLLSKGRVHETIRALQHISSFRKPRGDHAAHLKHLHNKLAAAASSLHPNPRASTCHDTSTTSNTPNGNGVGGALMPEEASIVAMAMQVSADSMVPTVDGAYLFPQAPEAAALPDSPVLGGSSDGSSSNHLEFNPGAASTEFTQQSEQDCSVEIPCISSNLEANKAQELGGRQKDSHDWTMSHHGYNDSSGDIRAGARDDCQLQHVTGSQQQMHFLLRLQQAAKHAQLEVGTLWSQPYATKTLLLVCSWAAVACAYYGLVQLDGELHIQGAASPGESRGQPAQRCVNGKLRVRGVLQL